ncbi:lysophospholipid acyltransferase family protein [Actinoplanes sp. NPDC049802]|uniref:lysophospholipid acyltransferase family protein n=1 Tax=Actinoplanes sp. NPDC049802 TaxID=3154742 RepID=UPI0033CADCCF
MVLRRPTVTGLEHLPLDTGAILCSNHLSVGDPMFLSISSPRHITFWAKAEYFNTPGWRGALTRRWIRGVGAIPVDRSGGRAALAAFSAAVPILRAGGLVTVFPEGTRSPDGRLYRGRTGAVRLAVQAGVPIIPVGVTGTDRIRPPGTRIPRPVPITVNFGPALSADGHGSTTAEFRARTDELIHRIQALTGQEYVPSYAR